MKKRKRSAKYKPHGHKVSVSAGMYSKLKAAAKERGIPMSQLVDVATRNLEVSK